MEQEKKAMLNQMTELARGRAIIEGNIDKFRLDGYTNLLNKYGTPQDSDTHYSYNQEGFVDDMTLLHLYEGNGLFSKIIDRPAEEAIKHGLDIDFQDTKVQDYVEERLDDLEFEDRFATAEKWARLYGGAIAVLLVDDGRGLEEPLDWQNVRSVDEIRVFERAIVQPDYSRFNTFNFYDSIEENRPYDEPEYYTVSSIYGYFMVHRSRCLVFRNGRLPEHATSENYRYWGIPEYVKIKDALRECHTAHGDGVRLLERSVQAIYKMKNLASLLATDAGEDQALRRLQVIDMARGILNTIAIDADGEDYDFRSMTMSGVKDIIDSTCNMLSAVTDIPQTILFGRSPAGENATGHSDTENYYNMVEKIQKLNMKGNTRTLIDLILREGISEGKIDKLPKYKVKFAALWSLSDTEQANLDATKANTEKTKADTVSAYLNAQILDPSEVRAALKKKEPLEIENIVTDEPERDDNINLPDDALDMPQKPQKGAEEATGEQLQAEDGNRAEMGSQLAVEALEAFRNSQGEANINEKPSGPDEIAKAALTDVRSEELARKALGKKILTRDDLRAAAEEAQSDSIDLSDYDIDADTPELAEAFCEELESGEWALDEVDFAENESNMDSGSKDYEGVDFITMNGTAVPIAGGKIKAGPFKGEEYRPREVQGAGAKKKTQGTQRPVQAKKKTKPTAQDKSSAMEYTQKAKGTKTQYGDTITGFTPHAAQRMRERSISYEKVMDVLVNGEIRYPGNAKHSDAHCYQKDHLRMVLGADGNVITDINMNA